MLVRELIERLAEMPPDLPIVIAVGDGDCIQVNAASRGGPLMGPVAVLHPDVFDWQDYMASYLAEHADYVD